MEFEGWGRSAGPDGFGMPGRPMNEDLGANRGGFELREPYHALALLGELGPNVTEGSLALMPVLLSLLKHEVVVVVRQAVVCGTRFFCTVLEEISLQLHRFGEVGRWLEDMWSWMVKFKDVVSGLAAHPGPASVRLLAVKFLEAYVLRFTPDSFAHGAPAEERARSFEIARLVGLHPIFEQSLVSFEVNKSIGLMLNLLQSASTSPVPLTIVNIHCLSAIARKRPVYYERILSELLAFDPDSRTIEGGHAISVRYSLKTVFASLLRSTQHPFVIESREKLIRALRSLVPGEPTEHIIRQSDKMLKNAEHASRDPRLSFIRKDDRPSMDMTMAKRSMPVADNGVSISDSVIVKKPRHDLVDGDVDSGNGAPSKISLLDSELTPAEQMIIMVGALLAEGERGAESLDILISQMQADLLADMVILNMRYLPKILPLYSKAARPSSFDSGADSAGISSAVSASMPDAAQIQSAEAKRDPRRDPRRLDPRRVTATGPSVDNGADIVPKAENSVTPSTSKSEMAISDISGLPDDKVAAEESHVLSDQGLEGGQSLPVLSVPLDQDIEAPSATPEVTGNDAVDVSMSELDQSSAVSSETFPEESAIELPLPPLFVDLTDEQRKSLSALAIERIAESYKVIQATGYSDERMYLLARLVSQIDADGDIISILERHIVKDYHRLKGHELVMYILYHLHSVMASDKEPCKSSAADVYEKFLLAIAKFLCNILPASDKAFSRLLNEAPLLPISILNLLEGQCHKLGPDQQEKDVRECDRITQSLGAVWSLILARPNIRQGCLDIALKCAIDLQDEVRGKAIRLVANKLHPLGFLTENIEAFAKRTILSLVDQQDLIPRLPSEQSVENGTQDSSISESLLLSSCSSEDESVMRTQSTSYADAQKRSSLFFALCVKKPQLLQLAFEVYGRAPKTIKQAIHWHVLDFARKLGPSCPELLLTISLFPNGSENLISSVLQVLTEEMLPSPDLITTVKQLYQRKLKDAAILIPILSSLSKEEVLPIFPRLTDLPSEKFQTALARILQGSAHTGPALTPAEVLVAIHDISPEKDGVPLKKIMEACGTCFEQRTVFTQNVLVKALDELIKRTPLPLLFMRTVIQAIDAYPSLVSYVMEILSKLVTMQVWRMPKLWPGFLKCASQTQPHSFGVLLKLPPQQLENILQKHPNLRSPLSSYASQGSNTISLPRREQERCREREKRKRSEGWPSSCSFCARKSVIYHSKFHRQEVNAMI
ncbi:symplekin isoform X2 [Wolffia australiana]